MGTWERRRADGSIEATVFHRNGDVVVNVRNPDGSTSSSSGRYRVSGKRMQVTYGGGLETVELLQLDRRLLVYCWVVKVHGFERKTGSVRFSRPR